MEKKAKLKKPKINNKNLIKEISDRTGYTQTAISQILETLSDIVFQCLKNKIEVPLFKIGTIGYRIIEPRDYVEWMGMTFDKIRRLFYLENTDGYIKPVFRLSGAFRTKLKEATLIPHGSVPSGENVILDAPMYANEPRINFVEYLKSLNEARLGKEQTELISKQEKDKLKEEQKQFNPTEEEDDDEYDSIVLGVTDEI